MNWFYESGGQQQGPVDDHALDRLVTEGKLQPETLVWHEGLTDWQPLRTARPSAASATGAEGTVRCASCGQYFPAGEIVQIGGSPVCPGCKPAVLLGLQQGVMLPGADEASRTGPAWENRPALGLVPALWQTVRQVLSEPSGAFSKMRREGGLGTPFTYFLILGTIGLAANYLFTGLIQAAIPTDSLPPALAQALRNSGGTGRMLLMICLSPLIAAIMPFIGAGVLHVCLMLCRGARRPFETTFRVYCYSAGSIMPLYLIPLCGGMLAGIWGIVTNCIGLARAHEIPTGKAVLAVFLPIIVACLIGLIVMAGLVTAGVAAAQHSH